MIGLVGLLILDIDLISNIDELYLSISGTSIRTSAIVELICLILMILFILIFFIFLNNEDLLFITIIAISFYYTAAILYVVYLILLLSDQTDNTCTEIRNNVESYVTSLFIDPLLKRAVKKHGLRIPNLTSYETLLEMIIDENCDYDSGTRWIFIIATFPTLLLVAISFCSCFLPLCLD